MFCADLSHNKSDAIEKIYKNNAIQFNVLVKTLAK